jgi:hypothetical protein
MSFFGNILEKLGFGKDKSEAKGKSGATEPSTRQPPRTRTSGATQGSTVNRGTTTGAAGSATGARAPSPASRTAASPPTAAAGGAAGGTVDVVGQLERLAANNPEKLNWRTSIVDLLKLLGMDSSIAARKELADELGAPASLKDGSAEMNVWLHRTVLQKIAENGGNVPEELLS